MLAHESFDISAVHTTRANSHILNDSGWSVVISEEPDSTIILFTVSFVVENQNNNAVGRSSEVRKAQVSVTCLPRWILYWILLHRNLQERM